MLKSSEGSTESQQIQNQWGFLKNIVNIDTFFSSGADTDKKSEKKESKVEVTSEKEPSEKKPAKKMSFKSHFKDLQDDSSLHQ